VPSRLIPVLIILASGINKVLILSQLRLTAESPDITLYNASTIASIDCTSSTLTGILSNFEIDKKVLKAMQMLRNAKKDLSPGINKILPSDFYN